MFDKIEVNGDGAHPLFRWLKTQQRGVLGFDDIKWNFAKFLVVKGLPVARYAPTTGEPPCRRRDLRFRGPSVMTRVLAYAAGPLSLEDEIERLVDEL